MQQSPVSLHLSPSVLAAGYYAAADDFPRHEHPVWELVYYTAGRIRMRVGDDLVDASAGTLIATPPNVAHSVIALTPYDSIFVVVDPGTEVQWPLVRHEDISAGRIRRVLEALVEERSGAQDGMIRLLITELDLLLARSDANQSRSPDSELIARAEGAMVRQLSRGPRLAEVTAELFVAPSTLRAAFLRVHGMPPRARLAALRLDAALDQLRTTELTLDAIARITGYHSASHLSRAVRTAIGTTPGQYRKNLAPASVGDNDGASQPGPGSGP